MTLRFRMTFKTILGISMGTSLATWITPASLSANSNSAFPTTDVGPILPEEKNRLRAEQEELNQAEIQRIIPTVPRVEVSKGKFKSPIFDHFRTQKIEDNRRFWLSAGYDGFVIPGQNSGFQGALGYQTSLFGPLLKFRMGRVQTSRILPHVGPSDNPTDFPSAEGSDSELNRFRRATDNWSFMAAELGAQINASLMTNLIPNTSQRGSFSLGYGQWTELSNEIDFSSFHLTVEGGFQYHIAPKFPLAIELSASYTTGWLRRMDFESSQLGRLPLSWFSVGASILLFL